MSVLTSDDTPCDRASLAWATWRLTAGLTVLVLAVRIVYLVWLSPLELSGDEAYYWEWSRHPDLCYYEKGPGQAYLVAASTRLFGIHEWSVRLPAAVLSALTALVVARLAMGAARGDPRAGFVAALIFCLLPAFQANAQFCTQDSVMVFGWAVLSVAALRLLRRWEAGQSTLVDSLGIALLLGIGFLFKQSTLVFLLGIVLYVVVRRRHLRWHASLLLQFALAAIVFLIVISPIIIWNHHHGWPTLAHTLGHVGMGGDQVRSTGWRYNPLWVLSLVGAQIGAIGPAAIGLMAFACAQAVRSRRAEPDRWPMRLGLLCCAIPSIAFYIALSFVKPVLGSWPLPSFVPLVVLVAEPAVAGLSRYRALFVAWRSDPRRPRPKVGWLRRRPDTPFNTAWNTLVGYGIVAWLVLSFPNMLARVPGVGSVISKSVLPRVSGHRERADRLQVVRATIRARDQRDPLIVSRYYMTAALYAFYLPDHPSVFNAGLYLGKQPSSYDFWADTSLTAPALRGRSVLLDGVGDLAWDSVFRFESLRPLSEGRYWLGTGYGGPERAGSSLISRTSTPSHVPPPRQAGARASAATRRSIAGACACQCGRGCARRVPAGPTASR